MLKHASNAGGPANGQLRNNPQNIAQQQHRSIHLRPPQPLNLSVLNASNLQNSTTSGTLTANGVPRLSSSTLLNIVPTTNTAGGQAAPHQPCTPARATPVKPLTPITPITSLTALTPLTPNGIGISNNLHTYTNQHILAHNNNNNNNNNNNHNNINHNYSNCNNLTGVLINQSKHGPGPREALTSLGLLCLVSLLLALLSLIFLLKISPSAREGSPSDDFVIVYDVTLALCALSLSLNLCCLLVCAIQFLFAVKLVRSPMFDGRDNKYLEKSSASRTCAVGGFFISIPIFLTGIILYTFNHFHSTPAIITSVLIGIGIVFCGGAMVHNVFIWQKEKTISYRSPPMNMSLVSHHQMSPITPPVQFLNHSNHLNFQHNHSQLHHPTSVTPVSPNHSHGSFNPLANSVMSSTFLMRPSTATPPTPKPIPNGNCLAMNAREASGSVSPGTIMPSTLDMSNITSPSLHELSTLV